VNSTAETPLIPMPARLARGIVIVHVLTLLAHMVAAVTFVGGIASAYPVHQQVAWLVLGLGVLQALAVFNPALPKVHVMYRLFAALVVIGEVLQLFVIPRGQLVYHVSVAMIVWGCTLALYVRLQDPHWGTTAG